jgi:hypothetical protein
MKYLNTYKLFESNHSEIEMILNGVSDSFVKPIANKFDYKLQLWDLQKGNRLTADEMVEVDGRLGDIGYQLLNISKHEPSFTCLVIETEFWKELKRKRVIFWDDLYWEPWPLNRRTNSNCIQSKFDINGKSVSIINGLYNGPNQIDGIEFWVAQDDFNVTCYDEASAEMTLIELQNNY